MNVRLICNVCSFHFSAVCVRLVLPVDRFMLLKVRHTHSKLNSVHYLFLSLFLVHISSIHRYRRMRGDVQIAGAHLDCTHTMKFGILG